MSDPLVIQSHRGPYEVAFDEEAFDRLDASVPAKAHFLIDAKIASLYAKTLKNVLSSSSVLLIEATEPNKSLDKFTAYVEHLVEKKVRRGDMLVAMGGGILQDIACFLAATLLRGLEWHFYPTTLLAQADSCIGSKSSINVGKAKNLMGTFTPPKSIFISTRVLDTLSSVELRSGIGEMLKVHAIDSPASFDRIAFDYAALLSSRTTLVEYIRHSLLIKKRIIEIDEFDQNVRNVMNYGHSFGHAIESATDFSVPHGIAVTMGMDMANFAASRLGLTDASHYRRMRPPLKANFQGFEGQEIPLDLFLNAISKDKKNAGADLNLILLDRDARVHRVAIPNDGRFKDICSEYLLEERRK